MIRSAALASALLGLGQPCAARAEFSPAVQASAAPEAKLSVELVLIGTTLSRHNLEDALGPQLRAAFEMHFSTAEQFDPRTLFQIRTAPRADLHVWIDATASRIARLYFVNREGTRFLVRRLELSGRMDEMDREALAQSIQWSLQALAYGSKSTLTREQAESLVTDARPGSPAGDGAAKEPPVQSQSLAVKEQPVEHPLVAEQNGGATWEPRMGSYYEVAAHSSQIGIVHGPALQVGVDRAARVVRYGVGMSVAYQLPRRYRDSRVALGLRSAAWRVAVRGFLVSVWRSVDLGIRIGAGLDSTWLSSQAVSGTDFEAVETDVQHTTVVSAGLAAQVRVTSYARVGLDLGLDADSTRVHYDIVTKAGRERFIERWWLHPNIGLGVELFWPSAS